MSTQPPPGHPPWGQPQPSARQQQIPAPGRWFAPPQQFQPIADAQLASQRSSRVATRALIWACVAFVVSLIPLLNWFTLVAALPAIQIGIAARVQRLGGGSRAVWAIVLASLALLGSVVWTIVHFVLAVSLIPGT